MNIYTFFKKSSKESSKLPIPNALLTSLEQELLEPLSGLKGMQELLSSTTELSKKQQHYIAAMADSIFKIEQTITTITQLAKEELSEHQKTSEVHFNIYTMLETIFEIESSKNTHINLGYYLSHSVPHLLCGHDKKLEHIIKNTTQNLIKTLSSTDSVDNDILLEGDIDFSDQDSVMLKLTFTVPKIKPQMLSMVDSFSQKLLKQLIGSMVEQDHSEFSILRIKIPLKRALSNSAEQQNHFKPTFPMEELKQAHVLVIDSSPLNTRIIAQTLNKHMVHNKTSSNFPNAITMIENAIKQDMPFTHILVDDTIPSLTPRESAEYIFTAIAAHPSQQPPKLMLLSQTKGGRHKENYQNLGYTYIITKPVREFSLLAYLCNSSKSAKQSFA